jgi:hypothetical protein
MTSCLRWCAQMCGLNNDQGCINSSYRIPSPLARRQTNLIAKQTGYEMFRRKIKALKGNLISQSLHGGCIQIQPGGQPGRRMEGEECTESGATSDYQMNQRQCSEAISSGEPLHYGGARARSGVAEKLFPHRRQD